MEPGAAGAGRRGSGHRIQCDRHRHRDLARQACGDLRGVPAGRWHHQPEVRRHRTGAVDQPPDRAAPGRGDPAGERARRGEHIHALPAGGVPAGAGGCSGPGAGPGRQWRAEGAAGQPLLDPADSGAQHQRRSRGDRAGRPDAAHRRGRSCVRADPAGPRAGAWLQGDRGAASRPGAGAGPRIHAHRGDTGPSAAGCRRMDHSRPAEARPGDPAHSGARDIGGGELAARTQAGRN